MVKDNDALQDIIGEASKKKKPNKLSPLPTNVTGEGSTGGAFMSERAMREKYLADRRQKMEEKNAADIEALKRNLKWRIADAHAERDAREAKRLKDIKDEQEGFVAQVDDFLENKAEQAHLASKELYAVWEREVYNRIEGQIAKRIGDRSNEEINSRLRHQMNNYVDAVQEKTLFRDIIIESEYNPFEAKADLIKVDARPRSETVWDGIKDPLDEQIEKMMEIHQKKTKAEMPIKGREPGKPTLPLNEWATGVIEDTPHGFANKLFEKQLRNAKVDPATDKTLQQRRRRNKTTLTMQHYSYARGKEAVSAEYPKGKRCFPGWQPGQADS